MAPAAAAAARHDQEIRGVEPGQAGHNILENCEDGQLGSSLRHQERGSSSNFMSDPLR